MRTTDSLSVNNDLEEKEIASELASDGWLECYRFIRTMPEAHPNVDFRMRWDAQYAQRTRMNLQPQRIRVILLTLFLLGIVSLCFCVQFLIKNDGLLVLLSTEENIARIFTMLDNLKSMINVIRYPVFVVFTLSAIVVWVNFALMFLYVFALGKFAQKKTFGRS